MRQFFKFFFASMLGFIVGSFVLIFLLAIIIGGIAATFSSSEEAHVKDNSVLRLDLSYDIPEKTDDNAFRNFSFSDFSAHTKPGLNDILEDIQNAKTDDHIKGIYLDFGFFPNGAATAEHVRNALIDFKTSGKFVVAYAELMTQKGYYVSSVADKIYLNPKGLMEFRGLNAQITFFKNLLDKIGVQAQVFYVGKFKTATEPFRYDKMSEPNRAMTLDLITHVQDHYTQQIAEARKLDVSDVDKISDSLLIQSPSDALRLKMVDGLYYQDQVMDDIKHRLKLNDKDKIEFVTLDRYNDAPRKKNGTLSDPKIAVLYAYGDIVDGKADPGKIGSETLAKQLVKLRDDDKVKAVVLRVNSPGGSALASDIIWREVNRLKEKKPVVVSMGDYAASGGYYISCSASKIVAMPNTLTGSIGVFGILPNLQGLLNDKLGVTFDGVKTGKYADLGTLTRPVRPDEAMIIQRGVDTVYADFLSCVSKGRNIPVSMVDSIAQGRVWTGEQALKIGLVDTLGDLQTAIIIAAKLANVKSYRVADYPEEKEGKWDKIIKAMSDRDDEEEIKAQLGVFYSYFKQLKTLTTMNGVQARMPYNLNIE